MTTKLKALVAGPLVEDFFCGFPYGAFKEASFHYDFNT